MSIIYKPRKHICTVPGKEKTGYIAGKTMGSTIDTDNLCEHISEKCSLTSADVKAVIEALVKEISLELKSGNRIRVGDLGIFSAAISSEVVDTKEDLKPKKVRVKTISYLPSVRLKDAMRYTDFMRLRDFNRIAYGTDEE